MRKPAKKSPDTLMVDAIAAKLAAPVRNIVAEAYTVGFAKGFDLGKRMARATGKSAKG